MPALKAIVAKLDDVPEEYRSLYVAKGDKFEVLVEGIKTQGDIDRLNAANVKERADHKATKDSLKQATDALTAFGDLKPDEVTAKLEKLETLEAAATPELAKNFEKVLTERVNAQLKNRVDAETAKLTKTNLELQNQNKALIDTNTGLLGKNLQRTIDDAIRGAASAAKLHEGGVTDALIRARGVFKIDDTGKVVTEDGKDPTQWIEERKVDAGHWWPSAQGAGAHGSGADHANTADNPFTLANWNVTKQGAIMNTKPAEAARLAELAGVPKKADGTIAWGTKPPAPAAKAA